MTSFRAIFQSLFVFISFLFLLSVVVYTRLEVIDDDDVVASATDINKHFQTRWHKHLQVYDHLNPHDIRLQIHKFAGYLRDAKEQRKANRTFSAREKFEQKHPPIVKARWQQAVAELRKPELVSEPIDGYSIHNCPYDPPEHYPFGWNLEDVLGNWNGGDTELPSKIYHGLCVFDWEKEEDKARNYREKELPFVVQNLPDTMLAAERWNTPGYLEQMIGDYDGQAEVFSNWQKQASGDEMLQSEPWYFHLDAILKEGLSNLYEELPLFDPSRGKSFSMVDPSHHRGIICRFGMKGIIAGSHFDKKNNFIALLGGRRRYILAHPEQCQNMELHSKGHTKSKHSTIDWSTAHGMLGSNAGPSAKALVNELVLQAGDLLYLPPYWFHFIVSLDTNYQCNSRSGASLVNSQAILDCGFHLPKL